MGRGEAGFHSTRGAWADESARSYLLSTYYVPAPVEVGGSWRGKFPPLEKAHDESDTICGVCKVVQLNLSQSLRLGQPVEGEVASSASPSQKPRLGSRSPTSSGWKLFVGRRRQES